MLLDLNIPYIENLNVSIREKHLIISLGSLGLNFDNTLKAGGNLTVDIIKETEKGD